MPIHLSRRLLLAGALAAGVVLGVPPVARSGRERTYLAANGWVPNNPWLAVQVAPALPAAVQAGWVEQWRGALYPFHHYHSTAHAWLRVAQGEATLVLGGPGGRRLRIRAGEALFLPVGTGVRQLSASAEFTVQAYYLAGQHWDLCREAPSARASARMAALSRDAVAGMV